MANDKTTRNPDIKQAPLSVAPARLTILPPRHHITAHEPIKAAPRKPKGC